MNAADSLAAQAYQGLSATMQSRPEGPDAAGKGGGAVGEVARSFVDALREGEATAKAGLAGQADMQSVVTALAASEMAIQTAVTMRDKVVEAYKEILRMPV
ncbi:MAG: flagellar hook-basal body complex protein FliE [Pseudomonadota bacterium]